MDICPASGWELRLGDGGIYFSNVVTGKRMRGKNRKKGISMTVISFRGLYFRGGDKI
jgi:hypothetical protein